MEDIERAKREINQCCKGINTLIEALIGGLSKLHDIEYFEDFKTARDDIREILFLIGDMSNLIKPQTAKIGKIANKKIEFRNTQVFFEKERKNV